ncbi:MAG: domain protein beta Propeller [Acidimicrobiales bacterium]|nr:domain protein beta Propeller [Acidimicrobiales bacterium]
MATTPLRRTASTSLALAVAATVAAVAAIAPVATAPAWAGGVGNTRTFTVRVAQDGNGGQLTNGALAPVLSANGRYVAFENVANSANVFVQDLLTGKSTPASWTPQGEFANNQAVPVGVSDDGNRVAFVTIATNLAPAPHTGPELYVRDQVADTTTRVNVLTGTTLDNVFGHEASMSADGKVVAWTGQSGRIWARTLAPAATQRVDVSSAEVGANGDSHASHISADGKHVVFTSQGGNLVAQDTNNIDDVFERNLTLGTTVRITGTGGVQPNSVSNEGRPSADGRHVAFTSAATNLAPSDANNHEDVFVEDLQTVTTVRMSLGAGSTKPDDDSFAPVISNDGTWIAFLSDATNLVAGANGAQTNVFARKVIGGSLAAVDRSTSGTLSNGSANALTISGDGSVIAFGSEGTNLVPTDTNGHDDVFVRLPESIGPHPSLQDFASTLVSRFGQPPSAVAGRISAINGGRATTVHVIATLAHDPAWAKDREPVARLYTAFFLREADLAGLNHWVKKHATGTNLGPIATEFAKSSEFKTKYGSPANSDFVKLVYGNVLQRKPDGPGLAHWTAKLAGGMSRGQLMVQFSESSEGKRVLAPPVDATLIGLGMLETMPTKPDFSDAVAAFDADGPDGVAAFFLDSNSYGATL